MGGGAAGGGPAQGAKQQEEETRRNKTEHGREERGEKMRKERGYVGVLDPLPLHGSGGARLPLLLTEPDKSGLAGGRAGGPAEWGQVGGLTAPRTAAGARESMTGAGKTGNQKKKK